MKKNMANISYSLSVITRSLVISQNKHKTDEDLNFRQSEEYAEKCIEQLRELFGDESDHVAYARQQLFPQEDENYIEHEGSPTRNNQSWN